MSVGATHGGDLPVRPVLAAVPSAIVAGAAAHGLARTASALGATPPTRLMVVGAVAAGAALGLSQQHVSIADRLGQAGSGFVPAALGGALAAHVVMRGANALGGSGHVRAFTLLGAALFGATTATSRFLVPPAPGDNVALRGAVEGAVVGGTTLALAAAGNFARGGAALPRGSTALGVLTCAGVGLVGAAMGALAVGGGSAALGAIGRAFSGD